MRILSLLMLAALTALPAQAEKIRVGVTPGPHAQIMEKVRDEARAGGLEIEILEFSDYVVPNAALDAGDIEANSFQHQPYLDNQIADRGYKLVPVAKTVTFPLGLFSTKFKNLDALPEKARVAIPNDPTNGGRALILLAQQGLISLRSGAGLAATPLDIEKNPKNIRIVELDAAQLPRSLDDVDLAAINGNYALEAGLHPASDALAREGADGPYANVLVVRIVDKDKPWVASLIKAYQTPAVKAFIETTFKGSLVPAW